MNPVGELILALPDHFDEKSEKAVLFLLLANPELLKTAGKKLLRDDFYRLGHKQTFDVLASLARRNAKLELPIIVEEARATGKGEVTEELVSGLFIMPDGEPSEDNLPTLMAQLREASTKRVAQDSLVRGLVYAKSAESSAEQMSAFLESTLTKIRGMETDDREATPMKKLLMNLSDEIEVRMANPSGVLGVPTGFDKLDNMTGGFRAGELIIVSGWTGRGKSTLVTQFAVHAAQHGVPAIIYSLEMTDVGIADRLAAYASGVEHSKIRSGKMTVEERARLAASFGDYYDLPFWHDFVGGMTARQICARAHVDRAVKNVGIIFVDHIGKLVSDPGVRVGNREQEVAAMSGEFDRLADELGIPVVLVSQMNRPFVPNGDIEEPTPSIHKLRESGKLEQDADVVLFTHRPHIKQAQEARTITGNYGIVERAFIIVGKCRSGEADMTIPVAFDGKRARFLQADRLPPGLTLCEPGKDKP